MKWIITISAILLFALAGCGKDKQSTNELITVDVTKNYPEKELTLQDFMDVEYIPLETNDEFVTQGKVMAIGAEVILITNWANDGNLFVFDRKMIEYKYFILFFIKHNSLDERIFFSTLPFSIYFF